MGRQRSLWAAYAAATWASIFAAFHVVWAVGWYPLLNADEARIAFAVPWKWAFDVAVAGMCIVAIPVALAPVTSLGAYVSRPLVFGVAVTGFWLLALRSVASLIQVGYLISTGRFAGMSIWEPWFYLGAVLFGLSTWRSRPVVDDRRTAEPA
jgi:hypothetical protein